MIIVESKLNLLILGLIFFSFELNALTAYAEDSQQSPRTPTRILHSSPKASLLKRIPDSALLSALSDKMEKGPLSSEDTELIARYIEQHPNDPRGHLVMGRLYQLSGLEKLDIAESISAWRLDRSDLATFLAAQAAASKANETELYDELMNEALRVYANDGKMLVTIAVINQKRGEENSARKFLEQAVKIDPHDAETKSLYLSALMGQKRYGDLVRGAQELRKTSPGIRYRGLATIFEGIGLLRLHQPARALPFLEKGYMLNPRNLDLVEDYFDALLSVRQYEKAVAVGFVAMALQPPFGSRLDVLKKKIEPVILKVPISSINGGIARVHQIVKHQGQLAYFYFALGDLMEKTHHYRKAEQCFVEGLNRDDSFGRGYMRLAKVKETLGDDPDVCLDLYRLACEKDPHDLECKARYARAKTRNASVRRDLARRFKLSFIGSS